MSSVKTNEEYLEQIKKIHGDKYDYSEVVYTGCFNKIKVKCKTCGKIFFPQASNHLRGTGCPHCNNSKTTEEFIKQAKLKHGNKYNYNEVVYKGAKNKIKIFCNTCKNYFKQTPNDHLTGYGCPFCAVQNRRKLRALTKEEFIQKAKKLLGNTYNYDKVEYINNKTKVKIFCNTCKKYFNVKPSDHVRGSGCPFCKQSKGELQICKILESNNIVFERQKKFKNCKDKHVLPFDFYIPNHNICIEFQGEQHYKTDFFKRYTKDQDKIIKMFKKYQYHDKIKKEYCKNNKIILYEITHKDNIEEKLKTLFEHYIK